MLGVDLLRFAACGLMVAALAALLWYAYTSREAPKQVTDQGRLQGTRVLAGAMYGPEAQAGPALTPDRRPPPSL
jgi:hypothetical protein